MKKIKHVRLPKRIWDAWEEGLLSGKYSKGTCALSTEEGFCCLGVLQMVVSGEVEKFENGRSRLTPSLKWLKAHGITFLNTLNNEDVAPYIASKHQNISALNDDGAFFDYYPDEFDWRAKYTFVDIVEFLKTEVEFTDDENP